MSYQQERDSFIARMSAEGLPLSAARTLLQCATTINRLAELACSSEAADRDRIRCPRAVAERNHATDTLAGAIKAFARHPCLCDYDHQTGQHGTIPRIWLQNWHAEQRAIKAMPEGWRILTSGDPRGYTLRVVPPSYAERNAGRDQFNLDSIGVPARESGIRW